MNLLEKLLETENKNEMISNLDLNQLNQLHDEIAISPKNLNMVSVETLQLLATRYDLVSAEEIKNIAEDNQVIKTQNIEISENAKLSEFEKKFLEPNHSDQHDQVDILKKQ